MKTVKIFILWLCSVSLSLGASSIGLAENSQLSDVSDVEITRFDIENAREHITQLDKDISKITEELKILDRKEVDKYWSLNKKYKEVRWEIVKVIQNINATTRKISDTLKIIEKYKMHFLFSMKELRNLWDWLERTKTHIKNFTRYLYKLENEIYDERGDAIDDLRLLVKADNIATTLSNEDLIISIMNTFNKLMVSLEWDQIKQQKFLMELNSLKKKSEQKMKDYKILLSRLEQKKLYLIGFIKLYKKNSGLYEKFKVVFEDQKDVYTSIKKFVKDISLKQYTPDIAATLKKVEKTYDNDNVSYPLSWPIYPAKKILTSFKDWSFKKQYHFDNLGIQIASEQWNPVYSSDDGVVYHVVANDNFTINWVVVVHPNNYVTIYSHMNSIIVKKGDVVKKWQLLGYSWWEVWTKGAWFASQGAWLRYYVFKNGVAIDPMTLLDLSVIQEKNELSDDYSIKFLSDKYSRNIDITKVNFAKWSTIDERAAAFLRRFAVGDYRSIDFWNKVVKGTNIDRDVVICIGFAESTLGHYLATNNNIGNVGNDDSGNRITFDSPLFGAMMIPNTLNNSHLGDYHTIKQLSRYGNKKGKVYASSPINWQTNVTKCLSQIKGYYVPEDYPFRTGPNPKRVGK